MSILCARAGEYDESEVARLCKLQHSEYGDFTWRATIDEYKRERGDSNASSVNGEIGKA